MLHEALAFVRIAEHKELISSGAGDTAERGLNVAYPARLLLVADVARHESDRPKLMLASLTRRRGTQG